MQEDPVDSETLKVFSDYSKAKKYEEELNKISGFHEFVYFEERELQ